MTYWIMPNLDKIGLLNFHRLLTMKNFLTVTPLKYYLIIGFGLCFQLLLNIENCSALEDKPIDDASSLKCDACLIISRRFGKSFEATEKEFKKKPLGEEEYTEAAESTCDEDWGGYGIKMQGDIPRLAGSDSDVKVDKDVEIEEKWERRLQDFCDDLLAELPDEKTLYATWSGNPSNSLETFLCRGEKIFSACSNTDFGPWPGDDYEDYDDSDFDYVHDEF